RGPSRRYPDTDDLQYVFLTHLEQRRQERLEADFAAFQHGYRRCRQVAWRLGNGSVQCWIIDFGPSSFLEFQ
ncbi:hypothetical protein GBAR_LOCUS27137, partial [Geodia barretti]